MSISSQMRTSVPDFLSLKDHEVHENFENEITSHWDVVCVENMQTKKTQTIDGFVICMFAMFNYP